MRVNKQQSRVKADKDSMNVLLRLMKYTIAHYKAVSVFVLIFIIISSLATVVSSLFIKSLIDDYITPLLGTANPSFTPLFQALCTMGGIYLCGDEWHEGC